MNSINATELRDDLEAVVDAVRLEGKEFIFIYRSKPAFKIVPLGGSATESLGEPKLSYQAKPSAQSVKSGPINYDEVLGLGSEETNKLLDEGYTYKQILKMRLKERYAEAA